jgi:nicotinamide-nucleotide amidase
VTGEVEAAAAAVAVLEQLSLTVATAESLTGGLVCAALTSVPGSSAVVRGGVVAYAVPVKHDLLGVDADLLRRKGAVDPDVCEAMARGAGRLLQADVGLATTGVAGPEPHGGQEVGTVYIAVALTADADGGGQGPAIVKRLQLEGDRDAIRRTTVTTVLALLTALLSGGTEHATARPEPPPPLLPT